MSLICVVDEAHRATGDYAYNQVVRYLMAKNSHFRILALTATPGGNPEAVQNLIDGLHISHIEIRDENSLDLKAYIHRKVRYCIPIVKRGQHLKVVLIPSDNQAACYQHD